MSFAAIRARTRRRLVAAAVLAAATFAVQPIAFAGEATASAEATYSEIQAAVGGVPTFVKLFPKAGIAGAWQETKGLLFSETALPAKTKALISLAVAAQIPCHYCVWSDTEDARRAGATDEEIAEAVAVSALTRHWSTVSNGLQLDFETYKQELSGNFSGQ
jgi:AhpD family alkylhydroperoxidase